MPKPRKNTYYTYRKRSMKPEDTLAIRERDSARLKGEESEGDWILRLVNYGLSSDQIDAILKVRTLEAFIDYCRDQGIDIADIGKSRIKRNAN